MKRIFVFLLPLIAMSMMGQTLEGTSNTIKIDVAGNPTVVKQGPDLDMTLESLGITKLPKYHALIIGVSNYHNSGVGLPDLEMPVKDAERLYRVLVDRYAFEPEYVTLLKDATREQIINNMERLAETVGERDSLLVFYAGHGYYDKEKDLGFWLPADAKPDSKGAWIGNSTVKDYLSAIHSKHTLLITDACFGGSIFKTRSVTTVLKRFNEMYKDNSRKGMTSGNLSEVPDKSVFIQFLLKQLEDNNDLFLSSSALFTRIYEPILSNTTTIPQYGIIQGAGDAGGDFIFIKKK